jgi:DNA polymerase V
VECIERSLNALTTNLVVADESRTEKTICLAVSPTMKAYGLPGRARLFEVIQKINEVNRKRQYSALQYKFTGSSYDSTELAAHPELSVDYIIAPPRMAHYMKYSTRIYKIYLKYIAPEDIHVYSIDEVFMDVTDYLATYHMTPRELAMKMIQDVLEETGITATAGIGTNLYLCKIAMDIVAKHIPADENGVRIAELDEKSYRRMLWDHRPLTDFWRVGPGYAKKLEANYIMTMGDIARCSIKNEDFLYRLFGVNAELLIDHAWGYEPCTIADIKKYKPKASSLCSGQVLKEPYTFEDARIVVGEMADELALDLVDKGFVTDSIALNVTYDRVNVDKGTYKGEIHVDRYGREVPQGLNKSVSLTTCTSSSKQLREAFLDIYDKYTDRKLYIRKLNLTVANLTNDGFQQFDMFTDQTQLEREKKMQHAMLDIKKKYGKNAVMKANNLQSKATAIERNGQIGGHRA